MIRRRWRPPVARRRRFAVVGHAAITALASSCGGSAGWLCWRARLPRPWSAWRAEAADRVSQTRFERVEGSTPPAGKERDANRLRRPRGNAQGWVRSGHRAALVDADEASRSAMRIQQRPMYDAVRDGLKAGRVVMTMPHARMRDAQHGLRMALLGWRWCGGEPPREHDPRLPEAGHTGACDPAPRLYLPVPAGRRAAQPRGAGGSLVAGRLRSDETARRELRSQLR